jgi:hypothetical protein
VESSILQATKSDASQAFSGLSEQELAHLQNWQMAARIVGIDAIEDLASRPWPCPISGPVIGVFQVGGTAASWMVIGHNGTWAVAACGDGSVSASFHSLAAALASIYPATGGALSPRVSMIE